MATLGERRQALIWGVRAAAVASAVTGLALTYWLLERTRTMQSEPAPLSWPDGTQSVCVGRFVLNLPKGFKLEGSKAASGSAAVTMTTPVTEPEFRQQVLDRWKSISAGSPNETLQNSAKKPESIEMAPSAVLFNFDHATTRGPDVTGKFGEWSTYTSEAHVWREGTYFLIDGDDEPAVRSTVSKLQPVTETTVPNGKGMCGLRTFFPGDARAEFIRAAFRLQPEAEFLLRVSTSTYVDELGLRMLKPAKQSPESIGNNEEIMGRTVRAGTATAGGFSGEEWIIGFTEKLSTGSYLTSITANWFAPGEPGSSSKPAMSLKLSYAIDTPAPPAQWGRLPDGPIKQGTLTEQEFLGRWSALLKSLHLRPGAL